MQRGDENMYQRTQFHLLFASHFFLFFIPVDFMHSQSLNLEICELLFKAMNNFLLVLIMSMILSLLIANQFDFFFACTEINDTQVQKRKIS